MADAVDFSFASYPASMVAGGSVIAAACGILGRSWSESFQLVTKLQHITSVDAVRHVLCFLKNADTVLDCSVL